MAAKNDDGFGKIIEAYGRAAAARSGLAQIYDREGDGRIYNFRTTAALQPDGTYRSWVHDALDRIYRGDLNKQARVQARALYSKDIYEMHKAKEQLKLQRGTGAERFGKGVYNTVDKTIELTGKVAGPVYREAVRPAISALWNSGKQLIGGLWNGFTSAVAAIYEDRMNRRQTSAQANDNQRSRDEERVQESGYKTKVKDALKYCGRRLKEEHNNFKRRTGWLESSLDRNNRASSEQVRTPVAGLEQAVDSSGDRRNRIGGYVREPEPEWEQVRQEKQKKSDDFWNEYLHVTGYETQKQINDIFAKRKRKEEQKIVNYPLAF